MSLTYFSEKRNRVYLRQFDHEEAARRYAAGESGPKLAAEYGVTSNAIYLAINPDYRERQRRYHKRWRTGTCEGCGGPAMRLISGKAEHNPDGRTVCARCRADLQRERLRFDELHQIAAVRCNSIDCANGERWQPPENFTNGARHREVREGGIHSQCRSCQTRAKRLYRKTHPDYNARQTEARMRRHHERRRNGEAVSPGGAAERS